MSTVALVVALALAAPILEVAHAADGSPPKLFEQIGELDRFGADARAALGEGNVPQWEDVISTGKYFYTNSQFQDGTAIVIPSARQLWQLYAGPQRANGNNNAVAAVVRDLDTLKIIKTVRFPEGASVERATHSGGGGDWQHAIDEINNRLFLITPQNGLNPPFGALEIDLQTFSIKNRQLPGGVGVTNILSVGATTYDPFRNDLLFLYGGPGSSSVVNTNTYLYAMDLDTAQDPQADRAKVFKVQSCTGPMTSTDLGGDTVNWEIAVTEDYLYIPCSRAGHIGIVVRMRRPTPQNPLPQEDYIAGPAYPNAVIADQKSQRLFMTNAQAEVWVFDVSTLSFMGVVSTVFGNQGSSGYGDTGWGLDTQTGRFFFQSPFSGLGVVEGRFTPVPQALVDRTRVSKGRQRILTDMSTRRILVLPGTWRDEFPRHYTIYQTTSTPIPPPLPSPDRNTVDVEETPGITESRFFSRASGYGYRAIWARGWASIIPAPPLGTTCTTCPINNGIGGQGGGLVDREQYLGRVFNAEYDTGSTSASAIGAGFDAYTRQQFGFKGNPASCSSSEGGEAEIGVGQPADLGPSTVQCPAPGGVLRAYGEGRVAGGVSVGKAWTETIITRMNRGILSQSTAVAQDITIAEVIHIGEVRSVATSLANGRPARRNMSTHTVAIKGVRIGDNLVCNQCTDNEAVARALTAAGGPMRMQFRVGTQDVSGLDLSLLRGSPGGALTAVQKSEARKSQDRALVADDTNDVPGLEMTVYNDNAQWGRARQIYQFAGVSTVANYNIVLIPQGDGFAGDFSDDSTSTSDSDDALFGDEIVSLVDSGTNDEPAASLGEGITKVFKRVVGAIGRGLRMFLANSRQFMLLLTAWALFGMTPYLARRRHLLRAARAS